MVRVVVFDMDGVLCRYRIERRVEMLASWSGMDAREIFASIWESGFEDEGERGVLSAGEYLSGFGQRMNYPLTAAQWVEARQAAVEPDEDVLLIARSLGGHCPVGMFTNNPWMLKRHFAEVFPAAAEIFGPRAVFSAELGRSKPDPEAFRRLASRMECSPRELLYFDDDEFYVAGAREAGLSAHQVSGAAAVVEALSLYGLHA